MHHLLLTLVIISFLGCSQTQKSEPFVKNIGLEIVRELPDNVSSNFDNELVLQYLQSFRAQIEFFNQVYDANYKFEDFQVTILPENGGTITNCGRVDFNAVCENIPYADIQEAELLARQSGINDWLVVGRIAKHEANHLAQDLGLFGELPSYNPKSGPFRWKGKLFKSSALVYEQGADCLTGQGDAWVLEKFNSVVEQELEDSGDFFGFIAGAGSASHGTKQERYNAYMNGLKGVKCH